MKIYKGLWRNLRNCTPTMHIILIKLLWMKTWMMHWMSSRNALRHSALSHSGYQSAGCTNIQSGDDYWENSHIIKQAKWCKAQIFLLRKHTYCFDSFKLFDLLSIFHIVITMGLLRHGCKRLLSTTTDAWGDCQELLYLIKCLANLPSMSIT